MSDDDDLREWSFAVGDSAMAERVHGATRSFIRSAIFPYFRVTVRGREKLNLPGPLLVAPVHRSNLDSPLVAALSERRLRVLAKESLFSLKPFAWYISSLGAFPLKRGTADREATRAARLVLDRGEPLLVFPEGTRQAGRQIGELFDGTIWLASKTDATIVPVGIAGSGEALPSGTKVPRRTTIAIVVGEPLPPPEGRLNRRELSERTEEFGRRLQAAMDQAYADFDQAESG